jgi:glycosyltransferase involved in cell wall biosynthesis
MRILIAADITPNPNFGAEGTEFQTVQGLRRLGHEVDEIWAEHLPHRIKHGNLHYMFELPKGYREAIRQKWLSRDYDVIHVNQGHSYLAALDHGRSKRPGVFVYRSHGLDDHAEIVLKRWRKVLGIRNRSLLKFLPGLYVDFVLNRHDKLAARYSSGVIVSSSLDRDFLIEKHRLPPERVACIPQAPPPSYVQTPASEFSEKRLRKILFVGGFAYWKGPRTVAELANRLYGSGQDFQCTWVCAEKDHPSVRLLLSDLANRQINLLGWRSQEELMKIYDENGIFVYPSLFDGFGKVFLEAMSRGLCVIATRTGGMRDIITNGTNGLHVDFNNAAEIEKAISILWGNMALAQAMSRAARETACQYCWDRVARECVRFYEQLLSLPPRVR